MLLSHEPSPEFLPYNFAHAKECVFIEKSHPYLAFSLYMKFSYTLCIRITRNAEFYLMIK